MPVGRPPKPTKLKIAAGNPGKRPLNRREPMPREGVPPMPAWMSMRAKAEWRRIVPELGALGLLTVVDQASLACYCQSVAEYEEATRTVEKQGRVFNEPIQTAKGDIVGFNVRPHPAVKQQQEAARLVKAFMAEFGLSPASRTRVAVPDRGDDGADGRGSKFFGGG